MEVHISSCYLDLAQTEGILTKLGMIQKDLFLIKKKLGIVDKI